MKRVKVQILSVIVILGLGALGLYYYQTKKVGEDVSSTPSYLWELALGRVHQTWRGDVDLSDNQFKVTCPDLYREKDKIPSELKGCRREIFYCYYKNREVGLKDKKNFYPLTVNFPDNFLDSDEASETSTIQVSLNNEKRNFELNDFCRQVDLPAGAYWGDRSADKGQRIWHTSEVTYSIDRFLVRNIDVREWTLRDKETVEKLNYSLKNIKENLFEPNVDLNPKQMAAYCHFRKSQILSSHVRSALSFHHGRSQASLISREPPSFNTPPHPFGLRQQESPQYRFSHAEKDTSDVSRADCRLIYAKECHQFPYLELFPNSLGWSGVSEIFGGPAEYVVNLKYPRKNLHPSSYYHPMASKVHQAGVRVYWSGEGHRRIDFNFFTEPFFEVNKSQPEDFFDVGFRCMKKRLVRR